MTDEEAEDRARRIARGAAAERVLSEPAIIEAFETTQAELRDQIVATNPGEPALREALFHQHLGLQLVLGQLKAWQGDYEAITEAQQAITEEEPQ